MIRARLLTAAALLAILALAAAFRLPRLAQRPMHADEANQAVKAGRLYETGKYEYDATDHHGPSLYWLTLPSLFLSGAKDLAGSQEVAYRIVPVIFGLGLIVLILLLADGLDWPAVVMAALLTAISPALVFYSRYYIQETLLVFFTLAALGCGWRYLRTHGMAWILAAGAAVGMMHATKETWILSAAAAIGAAGLTWGWSRSPEWWVRGAWYVVRGTCWRGSFKNRVRQFLNILAAMVTSRFFLHLLAASLTACLVAVAFFSMFGRNWEGPWKSIYAYSNYFHRGSQQGEHSEPWYYYLQLLFAYRPSKRIFWSEGFIAVLALIGGIHALVCPLSSPRLPLSPSPPLPFSRPSFLPFSASLPRFLTFYTLLLTLIYSLISYKTPWCALSFLMGMILLAGVGTAAILRFLPNWPMKLVAAIVLGIGAGHLGWQAYQLNFDARPLGTVLKTVALKGWRAYELNFDPRYIADPLNPYVYAHTPPGLARLGRQLDRFAQRLPEGQGLWIHVVVPDNYWPLPWYLRKFPADRVGYWFDPAKWEHDLEIKQCPLPDILILSANVESPRLAAKLAAYNDQRIESLRPGVFVRLYVRNDLWPAFLECQGEN